MSGETLRAPRQQLRLLRASGLLFPAENHKFLRKVKRRDLSVWPASAF